MSLSYVRGNHAKSTKGRIKILYCIDCLVRGGTELQLIGLIERLDPEIYEPYLLTIRPTDPALIPSNCVHLSWDVPKLLSAQGLRAVMQLARFLKKNDFSIVQTFFQDSTVFGGVASRIARTPVRLASCRDLGFWSSGFQGLLMRQTYKLMTGFICNAEVVKLHFAKLFGLPADRMVVLRNGVDIDATPWAYSANPVSDIGIVGNMTRNVKRTDLFIKAAGILVKEFTRMRFHVIGEGHLRTTLEELARSEGVSGNIVFAGAVKDVGAYLSRLQVGVICSDSEGLSNALIEYMLSGVVSIATNVGGNPELIVNEETGLLVPTGDPYALAAAMSRLIRNVQLRQSCATNARQFIEENYSWTKCLSEHRQFYFAQLAQSAG